MVDTLARDLKIKSNVEMAIRVVQAALIANQHGNAVTTHGGYHFTKKEDEDTKLVEIKRVPA